MCFEQTRVNSNTDGKTKESFSNSNPHLNMEKAMTCIVQRSYLVKAYSELPNYLKAVYLRAQNIFVLAVVSANIFHDVSTMGAIAYAMAGNTANSLIEFLDDAEEVVDQYLDKHGMTDEQFGQMAAIVAAMVNTK